MSAQTATTRMPLKNASSAQLYSPIASSATIRSANNARMLLFMWLLLESVSHVTQQKIIAQLAAHLPTALPANPMLTFQVRFALNAVSSIQAASLAKLLQSPLLLFVHFAVQIIIWINIYAFPAAKKTNIAWPAPLSRPAQNALETTNTSSMLSPSASLAPTS